MKKIIVRPITIRAEEILRSNTDKFGLSKTKAKFFNKISDKYTVTEFNYNPFSIVVSVKVEFEKYINNTIMLEKVTLAVEKIMQEHNGSIRDIIIEVQDD